MYTELFIGICLALISALIGYYFQSYQQRSRPFIVLKGFQGNLSKSSRVIKINETILNRIGNSKIIRKISEDSALSELDKTRSDVERLIDDGKEVKNLLTMSIQLLENSSNSNEILDAASRPIIKPYFDTFIIQLLIKNHIVLPTINATQPLCMPYYESDRNDERQGYFILPFYGKPLMFGMRLSEPVIYAQLLPFVKLICSAEKARIIAVYKDILSTLENEIMIAESLQSDLNVIRNKYERFGIKVFLSNYGSTSMIVLPEGVIEIQNHNPLACNLVIYKRTKDGEIISVRGDDGLLIRPGEDSTFLFISEKEQDELKNGQELRGIFMDGSKQARVKFQIITATIPRVRTLYTKWEKFYEKEST